MTLKECTALLTPLALALRTDLDAPTFRAYHRVLEDVPVQLLAAAIDAAGRTPREPYEPTFPTAPMLRALAERCRHAVLAAHPYTGCAECEMSIGWRPRLDQARAVERCACFARHQATLAELGVGTVPVALPSAQDWTAAD